MPGASPDGTNNFWGCGNASGTFYCHPAERVDLVRFSAFPNSRAIKIISDTLYASMNAADGYVMDKPAGSIVSCRRFRARRTLPSIWLFRQNRPIKR